jgi:hypothetical protein
LIKVNNDMKTMRAMILKNWRRVMTILSR